MQSIRKYLLIYLFLTIASAATTTTLCNYFANKSDIQEHQDTLMAISALSYAALLGDNLEQRSIEKIQSNLNYIPKLITKYYPKSLFYSNLPDYYLDRFRIQIWDENMRLTLHSAGNNILNQPSLKQGFSDLVVNNEKWRIFTTYNQENKYVTTLGEKYNTREEFGRRLALDEFYILIMIFPICGVLIWIIVGKALKSLNLIAKEISNREDNNYEPLKNTNIPIEIQPLIDELNMLLKRLKSGFEREARFAADAAHELKTPLAALKAQAQVALNTQSVEDKNAALNKVIAAADRTTRIVQQLLTLSKLSPEVNCNIKWQNIDLNLICKEILTLLAPIAIENKVELEFIPTSDLPAFPGSLISIGILLKNITENAINYCGDGGKVTVKTYKIKKYVVLEVEDNGPGIPKAIQSRVFERFFRALGNNKPGSGLGLSIVKEIAQLHKAKIKLDSPSKGTGLIIKVYFVIRALA